MIKLRREVILVVEDQPDALFMLQRAFRKAAPEIPIQVVITAEEAIRYLSGQSPFENREEHPLPALLLSNNKTPDLSGIELLLWIRQQPILKRLPVVLLSSSGQRVDVERAYDAGVNSYLIKPAKLETLEEMIQVFCAYWLHVNEPAEL